MFLDINIITALFVGIISGVFFQYYKIPSRIKWLFIDIFSWLTHRKRFNYFAPIQACKVKVLGHPIEVPELQKKPYVGSTKPEKSSMSDKEFLRYRYYGHFKEIADYLVSDEAKLISEKIRSSFWTVNDSGISTYLEEMEPKRIFLKNALGILDLPCTGIIKNRQIIKEDDTIVIKKLTLQSRIPQISVPLYSGNPKKGKIKGIVIALHGIASVPEKVMGIENKDYTRNFGLELVKEGYVVYAPYILNVQNRVGNISGLGMLYAGNTHWSIDVQKLFSLVDYIRDDSDLDGVPLIIYGISLGGHLAVMYAAIDKRIDIVISSAAITKNPNEFDYDIDKEINKINYTLINNVYGVVCFRYSDYARLIYPRPLIVELGALDNTIGEIELWQEIKNIYSKHNMQDNFKWIYFKGFHETVPGLIISTLEKNIASFNHKEKVYD